jgi:hypothetical protein
MKICPSYSIAQLALELYVHISSEADVIRQIPAYVVRIVVNNDLVRVPQPAIAVGHIKRRHTPIPSVEPEAAWAAADQSPHMLRTEAAGKVAVLPRMVEMIVRVVATGIVTDPDIAVYVRSGRVPALVAEVMV